MRVFERFFGRSLPLGKISEILPIRVLTLSQKCSYCRLSSARQSVGLLILWSRVRSPQSVFFFFHFCGISFIILMFFLSKKNIKIIKEISKIRNPTRIVERIFDKMSGSKKTVSPNFFDLKISIEAIYNMYVRKNMFLTLGKNITKSENKSSALIPHFSDFFSKCQHHVFLNIHIVNRFDWNFQVKKIWGKCFFRP